MSINFLREQPLRGVNSRGGSCFSTQNKVARALWNIVWTVAGRYSPRPMHQWRRFLLKLFGAHINGQPRIYPNVEVWAPWNLIINGRAGIGMGVIIYNQAPITLGNNVVISQGVHLCAGTHDYNSPHFELIAKPINIENEVWIAAEAFIHPGVTIGEGAVIGARSVVTKDMPAWTVCAGHPCKPIKKRVWRAKT